MRRKDRQVSDQKSLEMLQKGTWGVLSLAGDKAYGVPVNYVLDDSGEKWPDIFFHCAMQGIKLDYIKKNPSVCLTVVHSAQLVPEEFSTNYASVVVAATAEIIDDADESLRVLRLFGKHFTPCSLEEIDAYILPRQGRTLLVRLRPQEVTGKARSAL